MLPAQFRMPRGVQLIHSRFSSSPSIKMRFAPNTLSTTRFRAVVSKKVSKKAVERNRIRRILYGFLQDHRSEIDTGYDVLMVVQAGCPAYTIQTLSADLHHCLKSAGLLHEKTSHSSD